MEEKGDLFLWFFSPMENVLNGKSIMDEEWTRGSISSDRVFLWYFFLGGVETLVVSDQFKGKAVSRDKFMKEPRHQKRLS